MGRISNFQLAITQALISGARFAAEASKNLLHAESPSDLLVRGYTVRRRKQALLTSFAAANNHSGSRTSVRKRKPHAKSAKFAKFFIGGRFAAEASKNLLNAESLSDPLDRGCLSRRRKISRGAAEARGMFAKK